MNVLHYIISGENRLGAVLQKVKSEIAQMWAALKGAGADGAMATMVKLITIFQAGGVAANLFGRALRIAGDAIAYVGKGVQMNAEIEKMAIRMSRFSGSVSQARAEIRQLFESENSVADMFDESEILGAALALRRLSEGALGSASDMKLMADVALMTGQGLGEVSQEVGNLVSKMIRGDDSFGRYLEQMVKAGVIAPTVAARIVSMSAEVDASGKKIHTAGEMVKYMIAALETGAGGTTNAMRDSMSGLAIQAKDAAEDANRAWGAAFGGMAKMILHLQIAWHNFSKTVAESMPLVLEAMGPLTAIFKPSLWKQEGEPGSGNNRLRDIEKNVNSVAGKMPKTPEEIAAEISTEKEATKEAEAQAKQKLKAANDRKERATKDLAGTKSNVEQLSAATKEQADLRYEMRIGRMAPGTAERIDAEARILELDRDILKIKKDIADEEKKAAEEAQRAADAALEKQKQIQDAIADARGRRNDARTRVASAIWDEQAPQQRIADAERKIAQAKNANAMIDRSSLPELAKEMGKAFNDEVMADMFSKIRQAKKEIDQDAKQMAERRGDAQDRLRVLSAPRRENLDISQEFAWRGFFAGTNPEQQGRGRDTRMMLGGTGPIMRLGGTGSQMIRRIGESKSDFEARMNSDIKKQIKNGLSPDEQAVALLQDLRDLNRAIAANTAIVPAK